jgi:hypothetical protein
VAHLGNIYPYVPPRMRLLRWELPGVYYGRGRWYLPNRLYCSAWEAPKFGWPDTFANYSTEATLDATLRIYNWQWGPVTYEGSEFIIYASATYYDELYYMIPFVYGTQDGEPSIEGFPSQTPANDLMFTAPSSLPDWVDQHGFSTGVQYPGFIAGHW